MNEQNITLTLSVAAVNCIMQGLSQMPFGQVVDLVASIKQQAEAQLQPAAPTETTE